MDDPIPKFMLRTKRFKIIFLSNPDAADERFRGERIDVAAVRSESGSDDLSELPSKCDDGRHTATRLDVLSRRNHSLLCVR